MKTSVQNKSSGFFRGVLAVMALAALWVTVLPLNADAALLGTAGNAVVRNKVTVTYQDARNVAMPTLYAAVDVALNPVAAAPTVFAFNPTTGATDGTGATQQYAVTVITNSNGPGTIALSAAADISVAGVHGPTNITVSGTSPASFVPNLNTYGATTVNPGDAHIGAALNVAAAASTTFNVPFDSTQATGAGTINTLVNGNTVYLYDGTNYYGPFTVGTVTNGNRNGTPNGTGTTTDVSAPTNGTIQLTNGTGAAITSGAVNVAAGWQIVQARSFAAAVTVTQGTVTNPALAASWWTTVTATMSGLSGTNDVQTNARLGQLAISKYVRNITTPARNTGAVAFTTAAGAAAPLNGISYYTTGGVTANPAEKLEYLIVVQNTGTGAVNAVVATDAVPAYTTLFEGLTYGAGSGTVFALAERYNGTTWTSTANTLVQAGGSTANVAYGASTGTTAGSTMTFNIGQGAGAGAGGSLNAGDIVYIILQTTVN